MFSKKILKLLVFSFTWFLLWVIGLVRLDPDFGFRLTTGRLILEQGLPQTDPFSYTMPSWPVIDHAWLTDLLLAVLYPLIGLSGLSAIFATLALSALLIVTGFGKSSWSFIPFFLTLAIFLPRFGVRAQIEDWFFLALLIRNLQTKKLWKKRRWAAPFFILLWANLHGGFVLGPIVIAFYLITESLKTKKIFLPDALILLFSFLVTFLNPYGPRLWQEIFLTLTDTRLRFNIIEWLPFFTREEFAFWTLVVLTAVLLTRYPKSVPLFSVFLAGFFFIAALTSLRNMPLFALVNTPLLVLLLKHLSSQARIVPFGKERMKRFSQMLLALSFLIFFLSLTFVSFEVLRFFQGPSFYPKAAVQFLRRQNFPGQVFSSYSWGGYLIWQYPEKKVFIDGRMPSWRWQPPHPDESPSAFDDYLKIVNEGQLQPFFEQYNIQVVLWPVPQPESFSEKIPSWLVNLGLIKKRPEKEDLIELLQKKGWQKIYEDETALIYFKDSQGPEFLRNQNQQYRPKIS